MSTLNEQLYMDAVVVYGAGRTFSVSIKRPTEETANLANPTFEALDLSPYNVRFRVLGSATADATVLIEKIITQVSTPSEEGQIDNPENGEFTFTITADDTKTLGLGYHPIMIQLLDSTTEEVVYTLTEGGIAQSEFTKIQVVRI